MTVEIKLFGFLCYVKRVTVGMRLFGFLCYAKRVIVEIRLFGFSLLRQKGDCGNKTIWVSLLR